MSPAAGDPKFETEVRSCPVCGTGMVPRFRTEEAEYRVCPECECLKPWAAGLRPLELNIEIYGQELAEEAPSDAGVGRRRERTYPRLLAAIEKRRQTGRFLDIGCGPGRLLRFVAEHGWEAWGADPAMAAVGQNNGAGYRIVPKTLHDCRFEDGTFDVVHANEVVEHVEDVHPLVAEIARVLRPGGVAIFRTPHYRSWTASLVGPRWRQYSVYQRGHVGFLTARTFRRLFAEHGIRLVRVTTKHFTVRDLWGPRRTPLRRAAHVACRIAEPLSRLLRRGERLTVWGEKTTAP